MVNDPNPGEGNPRQNTDREIWREREDDYYADSIHVTEGGHVGINCGGHVIVKPIREWHALAAGNPGEGKVCPICGNDPDGQPMVNGHLTCTHGKPAPPQPDQPDTVHPVAFAARLADWWNARTRNTPEWRMMSPDVLRGIAALVAAEVAAAKREAVSGMHIWRCLCAREDDTWPGHVDPRCIAARKEAAK